mgnify:CR=1 FL=1
MAPFKNQNTKSRMLDTVLNKIMMNLRIFAQLIQLYGAIALILARQNIHLFESNLP